MGYFSQWLGRMRTSQDNCSFYGPQSFGAMQVVGIHRGNTGKMAVSLGNSLRRMRHNVAFIRVAVLDPGSCFYPLADNWMWFVPKLNAGFTLVF
jgi:hypothetical protein